MSALGKVLVTGGQGFIGASLIQKLLTKGYQVRCLDNRFRRGVGRLENVASQIELIEGDIRDAALVQKATQDIDIVFHLACINGTRYFYEIPEQVLEVSVKGALNTLEASIQHGVQKYVLASSSEVYQNPPKIPTAEDVPISLDDVKNPRYSYAGGKLLSELLAINYLRNCPTAAIVFRPHNIYGPNMGWEHVIPELFQKIKSASRNWAVNKIKLNIQGTGRETRSFCYIDDCVEGILIAAEMGSDGEIYHVGTQDEITIQSLIKEMGTLLNVEVEIVPGTKREGSTSRRCPDISKMKRLGYQPKTSLRKGLTATLDWYRTHENTYCKSVDR